MTETLYRKWRSQTFGDLIGQDAVTQTLRQAVARNRLAHAYLFCGPRGTGKTSTARLLAKMVNCANPRDGEPCNECLSCREITEGRSTDVFEIDAASNRGIDEIRDLRERVRVMSASGRTRVYVLDETHMLTAEAFNALLKTLEEPPPHVIFVLATTEAHKLPATVVSRCQRFDFRRISVRDIANRLAYVATAEGFAIAPDAVDLIARAAQGGMRDALSLLDQARAYAGDDISAGAARAMLGMADPTLIRELILFVASSDTASGLRRIHDLIQSGVDQRQLSAQIVELWRRLLLARAGADIGALLELNADEVADIGELAARFSLDALTECARTFARNDSVPRSQVVPQLAIELAFLDCVAVAQGRASQPQPATALSAPHPPPAQPAPISPTTETHAPVAIRETPAAEVVAPRAPTSLPVRDTATSPPASEAPPPSPVPARNGAASSALDLETVADRWEVVRKLCNQRDKKIGALLQAGRPVAIEPEPPNTIVVAVEHAWHLSRLQSVEVRKEVEWGLEQAFDIPCHVRFIGKDDLVSLVPPSASSSAPAPREATPRATTHSTSPAPQAQPDDDPRATVESDPVVRTLRQQYGATIVDIISDHH